VIHEAACWSPLRREWIFLPRRVSSLPYDEELDEKMGSNKLVIADESFSKVRGGENGTGSVALAPWHYSPSATPSVFSLSCVVSFHCVLSISSLPVEGDLIPSFH